MKEQISGIKMPISQEGKKQEGFAKENEQTEKDIISAQAYMDESKRHSIGENMASDREGGTNVSKKTSRIAKMGMLAAFSIVLVAFIHIPFPLLPFLEYDPADISIMIGTFAFGPMAGLVITAIVCVIQGTLFASTGPYGIIMHFIATGMFVLVAGNIYRHKKSKKSAILALALATLCAVIVMMPANYFITSAYFQMPKSAIVPMLPAIALFNVLKMGINSIVTFLVYKKISGFLHR